MINTNLKPKGISKSLRRSAIRPSLANRYHIALECVHLAFNLTPDKSPEPTPIVRRGLSGKILAFVYHKFGVAQLLTLGHITRSIL